VYQRDAVLSQYRPKTKCSTDLPTRPPFNNFDAVTEIAEQRPVGLEASGQSYHDSRSQIVRGELLQQHHGLPFCPSKAEFVDDQGSTWSIHDPGFPRKVLAQSLREDFHENVST
jgi:hypothetical protein